MQHDRRFGGPVRPVAPLFAPGRIALATLALAAFVLIFTNGACLSAHAAAANALAAKTSPLCVSVLLAQNGQAMMPIIVAPGASPETRTVAADVARILERITGAPFEIIEGDGSSGIVLGTYAQFPNPALKKAFKYRSRFDGVEAFAIRSEAKRLLLLGASDLGTSHAAYRFLESIGCRWYFPAKQWEILPSSKSLRVNIDEADRPAIQARNIWYGFGFFTDKDIPQPQSRSVVQYKAWAARNRMAESFKVRNGHAWGNIIAARRAAFEKHPEYLALVRQPDGTLKRQTLDMPLQVLKLNPGEPGLQQLVADYVVDNFRQNPNDDMVSVEPSDGGGHCECDKCLALGSVSNRVFGLANIAARALQKEFPGKMVGLYAYNEHSIPPTFPLEPNVYVELTMGLNRGQYTFDELKEMWSKKTTNMGYYLYLSVWGTGLQDAPQNQSGANVAQLRKLITDFAARKTASITCESSNNWGLNGRGYYIANKMMWNPQAIVSDLLDDFYTKAFGAGAAPMRRYWERLDPGNKAMYGHDLISRAFRDVEEASKLMQDDAGVQARLDQIKGHLHYVRMYWDYNQIDNKDKAARKQATIDTINWCYRTRFAYMEHYMAMLQSWARNASREFAEPDWHIAVSKPKPWETGEAPDHEEIERLFQQDLLYFQPQPVETKTFSTDLVSVAFTGERPEFQQPWPTNEMYQGGPDYMLYSTDGKPIELTVKTGRFEVFRDRPPAIYTLTNRAGTEILRGKLPLDNAEHALRLKVPAAGPYLLKFNDSDSGWTIQAAPGQPASIILDGTRAIAHNGSMRPMYFYVPRGTKRLDLFHEGYQCKILDPDGKLTFQIPTGSGDNFSVPVPDGMDGKIWSFRDLTLGRLHLFNVPPYIAASPAALLVPCEVAVQDGLTIVR